MPTTTRPPIAVHLRMTLPELADLAVDHLADRGVRVDPSTMVVVTGADGPDLARIDYVLFRANAAEPDGGTGAGTEGTTDSDVPDAGGGG